MKKELDEALCAAHPEIFRDRHGDMRKTLMCFGFPHDGWYGVINDLCDDIDAAVKAGSPPVVAVQVKEKFGTLRFYYDGGDEFIARLVDRAERRSAETCEDCGEPGRLRDKGWLKTLCDTCAKERGR